jgi:hypothetical protein
LKKIGNKGQTETGYIWVPYLIQSSVTPIIINSDKSYIRKMKINKIFNKGFIIDSSKTFQPKKSISSRYSVATINTNYYGKIQ